MSAIEWGAGRTIQRIAALRGRLRDIAVEHSIEAIGERTRDEAGALRRGVHPVPVMAPCLDAVVELLDWLDDRPFTGHWTVLHKGAGHRGPVFVFSRYEDALLMRLRWGDAEEGVEECGSC